MQDLILSIKALQKERAGNIPNVNGIFKWLENLLKLMFPLQSETCTTSAELLQSQEWLTGLLKDFTSIKDPAEKSEEFHQKLANIHRQLVADANYIFKYDPAAQDLEVVISAYPGFHAIRIYRIAHCLQQVGLHLIARTISERAHSETGIDIHPGAEIESPFFIDHGTGIVIGETATIKQGVRIFQGVTLGALSVDKNLAKTKRHPTIEENVVIYANATILGGDTVIGHDSVIGGNVWLTRSIQPKSVVFHHSEVRIKSSFNDEAINFII